MKYIDRIVVFENGKTVEEGKHDELLRKDGGVYRELWEKQML